MKGLLALLLATLLPRVSLEAALRGWARQSRDLREPSRKRQLQVASILF